MSRPPARCCWQEERLPCPLCAAAARQHHQSPGQGHRARVRLQRPAASARGAPTASRAAGRQSCRRTMWPSPSPWPTPPRQRPLLHTAVPRHHSMGGVAAAARLARARRRPHPWRRAAAARAAEAGAADHRRHPAAGQRPHGRHTALCSAAATGTKGLPPPLPPGMHLRPSAKEKCRTLVGPTRRYIVNRCRPLGRAIVSPSDVITMPAARRPLPHAHTKW